MSANRELVEVAEFVGGSRDGELIAVFGEVRLAFRDSSQPFGLYRRAGHRPLDHPLVVNGQDIDVARIYEWRLDHEPYAV